MQPRLAVPTRVDRRAVRALRLFGAAFVAVSMLFLAGLPTPSHAEPSACRREIARADARYGRTTMRLLQKCEDDVLAGKKPGPCPDAKTAAQIFIANAKLQSSIARRCGGVDQTCSVSADNDPLAAIGWDIGQCPNLANGACTNTIEHCGHVSACLLCLNDAAIGRAMALYYDALTPGASGTIEKCQRYLGREAAKFYQAKVKILGKCEDLLLKGAIAGPCPDARAALSIATVEAKARAKICSVCGGPDRECGTSDDPTVAEIGVPPDCPPVDPPGTAPACGGPVDTVADLVRCVSCVTGFEADCVSAAGAPAVSAYPAECNAELPSPTPTPGETATPAETATPVETSTSGETPTPAATPTPSATPSETPTPSATATPDATATPEATSTPAGSPACAALPLAGCRTPAVAGKAQLEIKDHPSNDEKDAMQWRWNNGSATTLADFGDPRATTHYQLCIYDGSGLVLSAAAPAGGMCFARDARPCWRETAFGFDYTDDERTPDGLQQLRLKQGLDGAASIRVKGGHVLLDTPTPPLGSPVTVQLSNSEGVCWEAVYSAPFRKNTGAPAPAFKDKAD
jgi:hypothetical protein